MKIVFVFFLACSIGLFTLSTWDLIMSQNHIRKSLWRPVSLVCRGIIFLLSELFIGILALGIALFLTVALGIDKLRPQND